MPVNRKFRFTKSEYNTFLDFQSHWDVSPNEIISLTDQSQVSKTIIIGVLVAREAVQSQDS